MILVYPLINQMLRISRFSIRRNLSLSYRISPNGNEKSVTPLCIIHGLLGSQNNFNFVCKILQPMLPQTMLLSCDLRNHGDSPHSEIMDYTSMSKDIVELLDQLDIKKCVLMGHSLGGRVAMQTALVEPERVEKLIVVDVSPESKGGGRTVSSAVFGYVEAMSNVIIDDSLSKSKAKKMVEEQLKASIPDKSIRDFVLTNFVKQSPGKYGWRVNIDAILKNRQNFSAINGDFSSYMGKSLFLGGELSNYITDSDTPRIKELFPNAIIKHLPNCGHRIHAEDPRGFAKVVSQFILE